MRKTLAAAVALAPIWLAASEARAAQNITGTTSTPVATATAANGAPDDVVIASGAVVQPGATSPAVTINSNNTVTNQGTVFYTDQDNVVAVRLQGGVTGALDNQSAITITENYSATDTNLDGVVEGPVARGTNRIGVQVTGGTFTGNINSTGTISVQGNNSYGVSIESRLQGSMILSGSGVTLLGNNGAAIRTTAPVSGELRMLGQINAVGEGVKAVDIQGDVDGRVSFYGAVTATGFTNTSRITDQLIRERIQSNGLQILRGGAAVTIAANVGGGVLVGAPPLTTTIDTTDDLDGDGLPDNSVGAGNITAYGDAPGMVIGRAGAGITLGNVGTGDNAYGLLVRGSVNADGVYDNFSATALQIGGQAGGTVNLSGGMRFVGGAAATAYGNSAYAVRIGAGVSAPTILNEGGVASQVTSSGNHQAYGFLIEQGAQLNTLTNTGVISAGAVGDTASAYSVVDRSGTLRTVNNFGGAISAVATAQTPGRAATGQSVALDLSANTSGVTLTQTGSIAGIAGDILLGSGANTVDIQGGVVFGRLSMGSNNVGTLNISGGARYQGALTYSGSGLAINVSDGVLQNDSASTIRASSLNVGATSNLVFSVDSANNAATRYTVAGAANFANGAKLSLKVLSPIQGAQTYTVVSANSLTVGAIDLNATTDLPFLFVGAFRANTANNTITLDVRRRTTAELGLNRSEAQGFDAIYSGIGADPLIQQALFSQTTQAGVKSVYEQLLPDYAGGMFRAGQIASEAVSRAAAEPEDFVNAAGTRGLWGEEIFFGVKQKRGDAAAYNIGGFGFAGGVEMGGRGFGAVGVSTSFTTAQIRNPDLLGDNHHSFSNLELGLYWRAQWLGLRADLRAAGGYGWYQSGRQVLVPNPIAGADALVDRRNKANWSGYTASARAGLGYEAKLGWLWVRPQAHADYFRLKEGARSERFGGDVLNLNISSRTGSAVAATASLVTGAQFGTSMRWRPSVEVGYRNTIAGGAGDTTFRIGNNPSATLSPADLKGGAALARVAVKADTDFFEVGFEAGGQTSKQTKIGDFRLTARIVF